MSHGHVFPDMEDFIAAIENVTKKNLKKIKCLSPLLFKRKLNVHCALIFFCIHNFHYQ